ncbi:unnamed protein product [Peniophora sp. CBMAI 1063]|nr:unnamed protein product [Peniophora sp. CBMAI 1063]
MLRAKQRLSAAFSHRSSHTSDEPTIVGSPLQSLDSPVAISEISVRSTDIATISRKLTILVDGRDIIEDGHTIAFLDLRPLLTWSIHPPLGIAPGVGLEIDIFRKRSITHRSRRLVEVIQVTGMTLIEACTLGHDYEPHSLLSASISLQRAQAATSSRGSTSEGTIAQGSGNTPRNASRISSKPITLILLRLDELERIDTFAPYLSKISDLRGAIHAIVEPVEMSSPALFSTFEALGNMIASTLGILVSPGCRDRPQTCPNTVTTTLALILNACALVRDVWGPASGKAVSQWLQDLLAQFTVSLRRAMRSIEGRKDEVLSTRIYDSDDVPSQHNDVRLNNSDSRSTLSLAQDRLIELLDPHFLPTGYPTSLCMEGTRTQILSDVEDWLNDLEAPNLLWLRGGPGMGKNTLIWTIANMLERRQRNASFFFFRYQHYTPLDLWRTVACSLAWYHPALKAAITANLERSPDLRRDVPRLFEMLIAGPLRANSQALVRADIAPVIVIGSLDACIQTDERQWHALLETLAQWLQLPKECKLVFTSCYHEEIEHHLGGRLPTKRIEILPEDSHQDISTYVRRRALSIEASTDESVETTPLNAKQLAQLVDHAAGFFLWARSAMDYVASSADRPRALETLATKGLHQKLDDVDDKFDGLLDDAFEGIKPPGFRATFGAVSLAFRPVSVAELVNLLGENFALRQPADTCSRLSSVLNVADVALQRLCVYHPAFTAYLTDARRVGLRYDAFLVDEDRTHRRFAHAASHIDPELPSHAMTSSLEYACQYWHEHLLATKGDVEEDMLRHLNELFRVKLLFWMEVMSGLRVIDSAVRAMTRIARRLRSQDPDLSALADEATRFVLVHTDAIASSAAHIYNSALAFLPKTSLLHPLYSHLSDKTPRVITDPPLRLQPLDALHHRQGEVKSVCVFPDGTCMLVAFQPDPVSSFALLQTVDIQSGATINTSTAIDGTVMDVKLYMDGEGVCAAVAVTDGTLQLWCLSDGIQHSATLKGHEDYVRCVDIDQTSSRLVSGSDDCTLIIWSTLTAKALGKPYTGHRDWIRAVLFTEDGQKIISGSDDKSIRVWVASTGVELRRISVHGSSVRSLALCPSGLISGGDDGTIVVTSLETGSELHRHSRAHFSSIRTIIYDSLAPYGASFVTGAADGTVQLWDDSIQPLEERLYLHQSSVVDIARVDRCLVSAAEDGSIAAWTPWNLSETHVDASLQNNDEKRRLNSRMGPVLLVQANEEDDEVLVLDAYGIWRWTFEGDLRSRSDFISESEHALGPASAVALSLAGNIAAIALSDGFICLVDASTGHARHLPFSAHVAEVATLALSADGKHLISSARDGSVHVWSTDSASLIDPPNLSGLLAMGIPEEEAPAIAASSTHYVYALDSVHLYEYQATDETPLADAEDNASALEFSYDGTKVAACSSSGRVTVWSILDRGILYSHILVDFPNDGLPYPIVFDSALEMLAYIPQRLDSHHDHHEYSISDLRTGETMMTVSGIASMPTCGAFLRSKGRIIVGSSDGVARIVDYERAIKYAAGPRHGDSVRAVAFAPDGRFIASGDDSGRILLWDTERKEQVGHVQPHIDEWVRALVFTPDGEYLLSCGDDCKIRGWRIPALQPAYDPLPWHDGPIRALVLSSGGQYLLTASEDNFACIWELPAPSGPTGDPRPVLVRQLSHATRVLCAAFSRGGSSLAVGAADGVVHLWLRVGNDYTNWSSRSLLGHVGSVNALAYCSNLDSGIFVSGGEDRTMRVWDHLSGATLRTIQVHDVVHAIAACPMGQLVFAASRDATIRTWDANTGEETALPLRIHSAPVLCVALSSDGRRLISGHSDGRVTIHDIASSLRVWPQAFQRSAPSPSMICGVDKEGIALSAQLYKDGWLRGGRGETLMWIPPAYRPGFCGPSCSTVLGAAAVLLDLSTFAHGDAWSPSYARSHQT